VIAVAKGKKILFENKIIVEYAHHCDKKNKKIPLNSGI
jgi:hypothetical protein